MKTFLSKDTFLYSAYEIGEKVYKKKHFKVMNNEHGMKKVCKIVQVSHTSSENVKTFVRNRFSEVIKDLENSSRIIYRNIQDSVSYRLEQRIFICNIWSEFVLHDVINRIAEAYRIFAKLKKNFAIKIVHFQF